MNDQETNGATLEGAGEERLLKLLRELVRSEGRQEAAELLGVSARTLGRTLGEDRLTARMRDALELQVLSERAQTSDRAGEEAGELARRLDRLENRVETLSAELRRSAKTPPTGEARRPTVPATRRVEKTAVKPPRRVYPQLVTLEPEVGEELLFWSRGIGMEAATRLGLGYAPGRGLRCFLEVTSSFPSM